MTATDGRTFVFGPLDRRGLLLGLRAGQAVLILVGVIVALAVVWTIGVPAAAVTLGLFGAAVFVPVAGRSADQWVPVLANMIGRMWSGEARWVSPAPFLGTLPDGAKREPPLPSCLRGLRMLSAAAGPTGPERIGVLKDGPVYSAVLAVRGRPFVLLDRNDQEQALARWGAVLASLCSPMSHCWRLQWVERCVPDDGQSLRRYLDEQGTLAEDDPLRAGYEELLAQHAPRSVRHELFLTFSIKTTRLVTSKAIRGSKERTDEAACEVLLSEVDGLVRDLQAAGIDVDGLLPPRLLARTLRVAVDPGSRLRLAERDRLWPAVAGVDPEQAWPLAVHEEWDAVRTDTAWHAAFHVAEWPRSEVGPEFLSRMLLRSTRVRTVAMVVEPIEGTKALRQAEMSRTAARSDDSWRRSKGFTTSARREAEMDTIERRERELVAGHGECRFAAFVTVTEPDREDLDRACAEVERSAQLSQLLLRRLTAEQARGLVCTLPVGRGLS